MILSGIARLGRDCEIRYLSDGSPVATLALAYHYGKKGDDGKRQTQWVQAALWGERAKSLQPHLLKGQMISVTLDDVHIETYDKRDGGQGVALRGRVLTLEFAGVGEKKPEQNAQDYRDAKQGTGRPAQQPQRQQGGAFADMIDDIPCTPIGRGISGYAI